MTQHLALGALASLLLALTGPASAVMVTGPGGTADQGRRVVVATPAPGAVAPTLDLVSARIEAVDLAAGTITLRGQRVPLHAEQLRVLGPAGQVLGPRSLRAGQPVRLALEPALPVPAATAASAASTNAPNASATPARRIVLIYIDG